VFSPTEYALRFAQTLALILALLTIINAMNRYPDAFNGVRGIQVQVHLDREGDLPRQPDTEETTSNIPNSEAKRCSK
jgi:hypothetical protein